MSTKIWSTYQLAIFVWGAALNSVRTLIIQAFAGTGKTTTLEELVNRMPEATVIVLTFSSKAKKDLEQRITRPGASARGYNSIGYEFCKRYMGATTRVVGRERDALMAQHACGVEAPRDMVKLVEKLAALGKATLPGWDARERLEREGKAAKAASNTKLADALRAQWHEAPQTDMEALAQKYELTPDEQWEQDGWNTTRVSKLALKAMELARTAHTLPIGHPHRDTTLSFDDQCYLPVVNRWVMPRAEAVLVDEAQDTNACQLRMAWGLLKEGGRFAAVGDRFQSIYRFRGADERAMDKIKEAGAARGGVLELTLPETYRCGKVIVAAAAKLVPGYIAHPNNVEGEERTISYSTMLKDVGPGDFILSRTNAPLTAACLKLWKQGKRAKVEGREVGAGLVALVNKLKAKSVPDFSTKLTAWEKRECERIEKSAKSEDEAESKREAILDRADCLRTLADGVKGLPELTSRIESLFADGATAEPQTVLMTVHKSKGLETDRVFLLDDTFKSKSQKADGKRSGQDEIFIRYVAMTRAKTMLAYVQGLEEGVGSAVHTAKHDAAVNAAAQKTGETLEQVAATIDNLKQLMEKNPDAQSAEALKQLEEKYTKLTQAKA